MKKTKALIFSCLLAGTINHAQADGMPESCSNSLINKKSHKDFSLAVMAGVNYGVVDNLYRDALVSQGGLYTATQPDNNLSYITELSAYYNLENYPASFGLSYDYLGNNKFKASPTYVESGGLPEDIGYTEALSAHNLSLNFKYHMQKIAGLQPYLGLGVGMAAYTSKIDFRWSDGQVHKTGDKTGTVFSQNVFLGAKYKIDNDFSMLAQAKYIHLNQIKNNFQATMGNAFNMRGVHNFAFTLGLEYNL